MTLRRILGIGLPIVQAPMAGAGGSALAAAVSETGALGSLPCSVLTPAQIRAELHAIAARTKRPVNVNFFCHAPPAPDPDKDKRWRALLAPYFREFGIDPDGIASGAPFEPFGDAALEAIEEFRPAVVSFHFGLPPEALLARVRAFGAKILSSATTVAEARRLEAMGVDAIIAQGTEAGGHRGHFLSNDLTEQMGTFALLPQIVRAVNVPVIAAGGIADARGVHAALSLGAAAVQVGTAYLLCPETTIGPLHRRALRGEAARHTAITNLFTGRPARAIVNRMIRELGPLNDAAPAFPLAMSATGPLRAQAEARGADDFSFLWCGQNASGCRAVPAGQLTRELAGA